MQFPILVLTVLFLIFVTTEIAHFGPTINIASVFFSLKIKHAQKWSYNVTADGSISIFGNFPLPVLFH